MKYENLGRVQALCAEIRLLETNLDDLLRSPDVCICAQNTVESIYVIGTEPLCEHPYRDLAADFVETIKDNLKSRIAQLKKELQPL